MVDEDTDNKSPPADPLRVPFLEVLHNNETGIFVKHVKFNI